MEKKRYVVLDALRGFAILGICLANFPEFSLWTFSDSSTWTMTDKVTRAIQTFLIDGKFYTLFSLLFGMGFSIQLENAGQKTRTFYRRMIILFLIGLCHLFFLWSGDILMLYAAMGMLLPLFKRLSTKGILISGGVFLALPVVCEAIFGTTLSDPLEAEQWRICTLYGITEANFGTWLADITSYKGMLQFLHQGAVERMWEFVSSYRFFKVLGLFLIGFAIGREKLFADLGAHRKLLKNILLYGLLLGIPVSFLYTWSSMAGEPFGSVAHSVFYLLSVYPMGFAYAAGFCMLFDRSPEGKGWLLLTKPGKVACTNYLMQSVLGVIIFYGIGFGLGGKVGLLGTEAIAAGVYALEIAASALWLNYFRFGPIEWVWRMLTYGQRLPLRKTAMVVVLMASVIVAGSCTNGSEKKPLIVTTTDVFEDGYPAEKAIDRLARLGYEGIDMGLDYWTFEGSPLAADNYIEWGKTLRAHADKVGIPYTHAHAPGDAGNDWWVERSIEMSAILGAKYLVVHPIFKIDGNDIEDRNQFISVNAAAIRKWLPLLKEKDVVILSENILWGASKDPRIIADLVKEVDSPYFGWCFDVGHAWSCDFAPDILKQCSVVPLSLHIQDNHGNGDEHLIPGDGTIDFDLFLSTLKEVGYKGDCVLEAHHQSLEAPDEERDAILARLLEVSRDIRDRMSSR